MNQPLVNEPASPDPFKRDREWLFREIHLYTSTEDISVNECQRCGALVGDNDLHARFHGVEGEYLAL